MVSSLFTATKWKTDLNDDSAKLLERIKSIEEKEASDALVHLYASREIIKLNVKKSLEIFSSESKHSAIFCHRHLPVVLAHFISGLDNLPLGLNAMKSIRLVRQTLLSSFTKLVTCVIPVSQEQTEVFRTILEEIEESHADRDLLQTTAVGVLELKEHLGRHRRALLNLKYSDPRWSNINISENEVLPYRAFSAIQAPLDFCNRCMIEYNFFSRMLINSKDQTSSKKKVGMVDLEINLERIVRRAVDDAKQICTDHYGDCPDVVFEVSTDSEELKFAHMSTTVRYIVLELMKNAFRATVEAHMAKNDLGIVTCADMPPVRVLINLRQNTEHACICISDEGNGLSDTALEMAMAYSYTSVSNPALQVGDSETGKLKAPATPSPLAGYGYGLPMSRIYAEAFGGDLVLQSMEGFGTRAYYYIKHNV